MSYIGTGVETVTFNTATTLDVAGNITLGGTVDGRDVATDGTKLDTITSGAIADILQDTTPQLGGNLDLNTSNIIGTGNINVTGSITGTSFVSTGNMSFTNNSKAIFGTSPSLEIYHDGSNSILDDVGAGNFKMQLAGADKLEITSTGVDVTGTVIADNVGIGTAPESFAKLEVKTATDRNIAIFDNAAGPTISAITDAGASQALRIAGQTIIMTGAGGSGAEHMRIDSSGAVVINNSGGDAQLYMGGTSGTSRMYLARSGLDSLLWNVSNGNMRFGTNNAERMRIDSIGNVGIGTTTPDAEPRLHVRKGDAGGVDSAANSVLTLENNTTAVLQFLTPNNASQQIRFGDPQDTGAGFIQYNHSANAIQFGTNGPEKMRLDSSGNLGIGTSNPGMLLDVDASGGSANDIARFSGRNSAGLTFRNATSQDFIIHTATSDALIFGTNGNNERMRITSSGNVGIGCTPATKLQVSGAVSSTGTGAGNAAFKLQEASNNPWYLMQFTGGAFSLNYNGTTGGASKLLVDANGKLCVGTTTAVTSAMLTIQPADTNRIINTRNFNTTTQFHHVFQNSAGTTVGSIQCNNAATAYNTSSDYRLKTAIEYNWDATSRLKQLKPARFEWIIDGDDAVPVDGFLAHEVQDIVPEAISGTKDAIDEDGNPEYQGIDQSKLVPLLVKTIQELEARIAALENT